MSSKVPLILFGAFDRHNFGDLLFAHLWAEQFKDRELIFAGLAQRDLTPYGGHRVQAISQLAQRPGQQAVDILHVGGELLTCSLYEAAIMTLPPEAAPAAIARHDPDPAGRSLWAQQRLGLRQEIGYLVPRGLFPHTRRLSLHAVGGMGLNQLPDSMRSEVIAHLQGADHLSVRDHLTQTILAQAGIRAPLSPDAAHRVAELFGVRIARHGRQGEPLKMRTRFPQGYLAMQFSADFGDDPTLHALAAQLDACGERTGLGIVLFRAGAAPWHDELTVYRRLAGFMRWPQCHIFESLNLWDICALLGQARAYCGSSLHGRIVAQACSVAGVSLVPDVQTPYKAQAYCATWLPAAERNVRPVGQALTGIEQALTLSSESLQQLAAQLASQARAGMSATLHALGSTD
ncbi:polysaccharide pyruvyl transferase [Sulfuritortus calidifontis]|uniref:Polysaccharide pyruvyl transferase n=1 Tax=Sulfuritortus calidifontis TaxID=1914471 RepID=A0A4R3JWA7_9PROT|nr:polysaccharide pyruvyl transferase family protein [Sulfuritortus calidifontis]TCS71341.1 polysaccharide pyruvyl transferase [Sulfuritortus calidifontis]